MYLIGASLVSARTAPFPEG